MVTSHIKADGANSSQLATKTSRVLPKSNYCVLPVTALESDPDLSDNDPTFQDPKEISTRLRNFYFPRQTLFHNLKQVELINQTRL